VDQPISLETVVGFLLATPLFGGLDAAERGEVVRIMDVRRLQTGEEIFHEGDAGDAWYVIFEGQANVLKDAAGGPTPISTLGVGACFGEMAILDGLARSATVRAAGPLTIFRFRRERFEDLSFHPPEMAATTVISSPSLTGASKPPRKRASSSFR